MNKKDFLKQYQTKEWYETSKRIKARDHNTCQMCGCNDKSLSVHHRYYGKNGSLKVPDSTLVTLCERCHKIETCNKEELPRLLDKTISLFNKSGLSLELLRNYIIWATNIEYLIKNNQIKNYPFLNDFLKELLSSSISYSDIVAIKKLSLGKTDFREIVERDYPQLLEEYDKITF